MDPVLLALSIKGLATLGLIIGGLMALRYGFLLYAEGTGAKKDSYALEMSGLKLKANSVGSILMATAFAWAWAAVAMSPSLSQSGESIQVYSFHTPEGEITTRAMATRAPASAAGNPEELKTLFRRAVASSAQTTGDSVVSFQGQPASFDLKTLEATSNSAGAWELSARAETVGQGASLIYEPRVSRGKITFVPAKAQAEPKR